MDPHFDLDPTAGRIALQISDAVRRAIQAGRLQPGAHLPPSRRLAADLGVSRGPVIEAYEQLIAEGYLTARQGSGTRVAERAPSPPLEVSDLMEAIAATMAVPPRLPTPSDIRYDLRPGLPDLALFPRAAWLEAQRQVARTIAHRELAYPPPAGTAALRAALAGRLSRVRGVRIPPGDVVVTAGQTQAVAAVARALRAAGHGEIAVEDPTDPRESQLLRSMGLRTVGVPVDGAGLDVEAVHESGVRAVLVTPAHQYPTGAALSPHRRARLVEWARGADGIIVEDDYDSELRYDRRPVTALQALAPDRVVLAGSVTKTLAPALRLGWAVAPAAIARTIAVDRATTDFGSPALDQHALAHLLDSGGYAKHLRSVAAEYRARRQDLFEALRHFLPDTEVRGVPVGLHVYLELPGRDEAAVVRAAAERGVAVEGVAHMRLDAPGPAALVLGFGQLTRRALPEAVRALADAVGTGG